jgi:hypothetical protein
MGLRFGSSANSLSATLQLRNQGRVGVPDEFSPCCGMCEQRESSAAFAAIGYPKQLPFVTPRPGCDACYCE